MGWVFHLYERGTHANIDEALMGSHEFEKNGETIKVTQTDCRLVNFNRHYHVVRYNGVPQAIVVTLIDRRRAPGGGSEWGYKDMDESMHPYYYDCPLELLDIVPTPDNQNAREWRENVRKFHESKPKRVSVKNLQPGDKIVLNDGLTVKGTLTVSRVYNTGKTGRGRYIVADGYRILQKHIKEVIPLGSEA